MNILLLDGHTVQSISVARSLKEYGCKVFALVESKLSFGYVCRYIDKKFVVSSMGNNVEEYKKKLFGILQKNKIDIIIPMYDDSSTFLSKHRDEIEYRFNLKCAIVKYDTYIKAHDKALLMCFCEKNGIPHPRTSCLSLNNISAASDYVGFPAMIKPNISAGAKGISFVKDKDELISRFPKIREIFGECTLQQYINHTGIYYNVMLFRDSSGICHESVTLKIMRYFPLKGGTSCYCEVIKNDYLHSICAQTLEQIEWVGFADFDIMEDAKTGDFKIIEINPRIPASIHAAFISGVNFPEMIISDLSGEKIRPYTIKYGKSIRFMGLDVMWFLFSSHRFSFRPSWFNFFGRNVSYQDGSIKDPLPMLMGMISGIVKYLNPAFRHSKL